MSGGAKAEEQPVRGQGAAHGHRGHVRFTQHTPQPAPTPTPAIPAFFSRRPAADAADRAPAVPGAPPVPAPAARPSFVAWLRAPRSEVAPGVWTYEHKPKAPEEPDRIPGQRLLSGALISALCGWLVWSLIYYEYFGSFYLWPLYLLTPESWVEGDDKMAFVWAWRIYQVIFAGVLAVIFGRVGHWPEVWRRYVAPLFRRAWDEPTPEVAAAGRPEGDPVEWPHLRAAGAHSAADRLAADARAGAMNDVDHARIERAWQSVRAGRNSLASFTDTVLRHGAASYAHPSGARDLPVRTARHDLLAHQVRLGTAAEDSRNPYQHRGVGLALDPEVLGTSLLAVGPPGSGKTGRVVRPVVESLCLQALAGQVAVVAVGAAGPGSGRMRRSTSS
ncbi:hypothetical protein SVIO_076640 [Streptomyces violaceusniger]|uniref:ATP-binding protein n=1 Tax=Streptomyces violaceusniger TaxID=68280 RepID=A0A4D4L628_STRVO|nr:hypothetical protein SVIO_076640 [Streptomyces violaceusniger]